jgi:hypothetical protein
MRRRCQQRRYDVRPQHFRSKGAVERRRRRRHRRRPPIDPILYLYNDTDRLADDLRWLAGEITASRLDAGIVRRHTWGHYDQAISSLRSLGYTAKPCSTSMVEEARTSGTLPTGVWSQEAVKDRPRLWWVSGRVVIAGGELDGRLGEVCRDAAF